ncbi:hypothetical protein Q7I36_10275 [Aeromonas veronii]|uniref:hypothetical protein n=1 Tax=Aeromonas veronii TaxID=654 RepID=UPI00191F9B91|nr:hypothetical protein [Aeromonas veronii]MBL0621868.1 hypothetical protein [Aeromonas veronii]
MKHSLMVMGLATCLALSGCQNMDTKKVLIGAAALGAIGAAGYYAGKKHSDNKHKHDGQHDDSDDQHMATSKMPRYCSGEAASKFHVSPRDITTESAEESGHRYKVYGQYETDDDLVDFTCTFNHDGRFLSVVRS